MKKHITFGLSTAVTLLLCLLFGNENTYRIASILLIFPVILAVIFYRKRGLIYAALILLVSLLIPIFLIKNPYTTIQSVVEVLLFFSLAVTRYFVESRRETLQSELDVFFEINADMMCITNLEGYFLRVNPSFGQVLGYETQELEGHQFLEFVHPDDQEDTINAAQSINNNNRIRGFVNRYLCKNGEYRYIEWQSAPPIGATIYSTARDITAQKQADLLQKYTILRYEALQKVSAFQAKNEAELLNVLLEEALTLLGCPAGYVFFADADTNKLSLAACKTPHGACNCPPEAYQQNPLLLQTLASDKAQIFNDTHQLHEQNLCFDTNGSMENLLILPVRDAEAPIAVLCIGNKATPFDQNDQLQLQLFTKSGLQLLLRRRAEAALKQQKQWFETTLLSIHDGVVATYPDGRIRFANQPALTFAPPGVSPLGQPISEVYHFVASSGNHPIQLQTPLNPQAEKRGIYAENLHCPREDGTAIDLDISASAIRSDNQTLLGYLFIFKDVTQKNRDAQEIRFLTYHDKLTGLYNRRFFEEELHRLDEQQGCPLSIIIGDVNGLKLTNDAFGHLAGDLLLTTTADIIRESVRQSDVAARWGGDEYGILLPGTDEKTAKSIAQRIHEKCAATNISNITLSISLGVATKTQAGEDVTDVLRRADDAMYCTKLLESRSMKSTAVKTILRVLHEKKPAEEAHSNRVSSLCRQIGQLLELPTVQLDDLALLGKIHDIGKISVPDAVLSKEGPLNEEELEDMKRHAESGYHIVNASPELSFLANEVLCHHECWDGTGYPGGLSGGRIPLLARILSVADVYDEMTNGIRGPQLANPAAISELRRVAGKQLDPMIVEVFTHALEQDKAQS
ncbi:MAG: diguanylate cyclase [Pygmaiobacter sp.]|nr:diguanylate cyclase [Pygmaiobacter sp.]